MMMGSWESSIVPPPHQPSELKVPAALYPSCRFMVKSCSLNLVTERCN